MTSASAFETLAAKGFCPYLAQPAQSYVITIVLTMLVVSKGIPGCALYGQKLLAHLPKCSNLFHAVGCSFPFFYGLLCRHISKYLFSRCRASQLSKQSITKCKVHMYSLMTCTHG